MFVLLLAFAYVSVADNILPRTVQDVLFFVVLLIELGLIAAGWRFYFQNRKKAEIRRVAQVDVTDRRHREHARLRRSIRINPVH